MQQPIGLLSHNNCQAMDANDPLAHYRDEFALPEGVIYLDGNSLGALPRRVSQRLRTAIDHEWGNGLIRSWNEADWYLAPQRAGAMISQLIGADKDEVIVCDSTSVNLYKVLMGALKMRPGRRIILSERGNFPTDVYVSSSVAEERGVELRAVDPDRIAAAIAEAGRDLAVLHLTHVNYKTGAVYDMAGITAAVHAQGGLVIWDLCHSAGTLEVDLNGCNVDLAVGCGYKYLNGGPGAPAFVFVAKRHIADFWQPIAGWHGHAKPFSFGHDYAPDPGIARMLVGTAPQLGLIALETALGVFACLDMRTLRRKGQELGDLFIRLVDQELSGHGFGLASPRDAAVRGSQVSLTHPQGYAIMQAVIARGAIGDFRAPDILRFGFAGLYVGFADVWDAVAILRDVMDKGLWDTVEYRTVKAVT
ncbi:kynureninase [Rhizobium sp. PL01]|uniref:kynureninase n=1 Tax=Rhizobium sp. PL01 TaxID=3085631 RepID=UPI00298243B5|nr:kynureninase [Rhizobium sp. PL01]MDW5318369.1 kynureninase [Rhizobium sp. PL01]